jgi:amino acid transporter
MMIISIEEYKQRLNPWLNPQANFAHYIPLQQPKFRHYFLNEIFVLAVSCFVFMTMVILIRLLMAGQNLLMNMGDSAAQFNSGVSSNMLGTWLLVSLMCVIVFRGTNYFLSRARDEFAVYTICVVTVLMLVVTSRAMLSNEPPASLFHGTKPGLDWVVYGICVWVYAKYLLKQMVVANVKASGADTR